MIYTPFRLVWQRICQPTDTSPTGQPCECERNSAMDYSKWEALSKEVETGEIQERDQIRETNRQDYLKEQAEKQARLPPNSAPHRSCCGYADPEHLKALTEQQRQKPQLSAEELYAKQLAAVQATREHGNQLVKEGNLDQAFQVYERGALILAGMLGTEDLTGLECTLNLNMALVKLKQKDYLKCVECVQMALVLQPSNTKALYRLGMAHLGMGNLREATENFKKVLSLDPSCQEAKQQLQAVRTQQEKEKLRETEFARHFAEKMSMSASNSQTRADKQSPESHTRVDLTSDHEGNQDITGNIQSPVNVRLPVSREQFGCSSAETVRTLLESLEMGKYSDLLIEEGFDSLLALKALTIDDLIYMGFKRGHARVVFQKVQTIVT